MFLDSGNIISDHTFYAQSQIMVEKFPNFQQNLAAFVRGWRLLFLLQFLKYSIEKNQQ